ARDVSLVPSAHSHRLLRDLVRRAQPPGERAPRAGSASRGRADDRALDRAGSDRSARGYLYRAGNRWRHLASVVADQGVTSGRGAAHSCAAAPSGPMNAIASGCRTRTTTAAVRPGSGELSVATRSGAGRLLSTEITWFSPAAGSACTVSVPAHESGEK